MKRIAIIGANSRISRNFIYYVKDKVCLDLYDVQDGFLDGGDYNYTKVDLTNLADVEKIDCSCDALYLFAGLTGAERSMNQANLFIDINEKAFINVLNRVKSQNPDCHIIYPSSRLVYKDAAGALKEDGVLEGKSVYALNKIFCENALSIYHELYGLNYTIFRIAIPFGRLNSRSESYGIVATLTRQAEEGEISLFGTGEGVRTFTHIKDICEILYSALTVKELKNDVFNVGGHAHSFLELAQIIAKRSNCRIAFKKWPETAEKVEVFNGHLDSAKLDKHLKINYKDIKEELY